VKKSQRTLNRWAKHKALMRFLSGVNLLKLRQSELKCRPKLQLIHWFT